MLTIEEKISIPPTLWDFEFGDVEVLHKDFSLKDIEEAKGGNPLTLNPWSVSLRAVNCL